MATQVASLYGVLKLDDKEFKMGVSNSETSLSRLQGAAEDFGRNFTRITYRMGRDLIEVGGKMSQLGSSITTLTDPLVKFGQQALDTSMTFDESMKNIQAAAGYTDNQMIKISDQVTAIGEASRYGPLAAADAFYEIAGGVSDASARMGTFEAVVAAAQAGNADLGATTSAMIAIMNSYGFSAEQATDASDVLTRMVGTGVGSMDQFAGAIPKAASGAAALGISFADVGAQMAFLTTKGFTASEAATKLTGMMSALVSPSADVAKAIEAAGYSSGRAMIEAEGLAGAYEILAQNNGGNLDGLIKDQEALSGATALATDEFVKFDEAFKGSQAVMSSSSGTSGFMAGMDAGKVTEFTKGIQGATEAAENIQLDSAVAQLDLLNSKIETLELIVGTTLQQTILDLANNALMPMVQGVMDWVKANPQAAMTIMMVVGAAAILGTVLTVAGTAISAIGTALTVLSGPVGLAILAIAALGLAYTQNLGGLKDFIDNEVAPRVGDFIKTLQDIWTTVSPGLMDLKDWFLTTGMPLIMAPIRLLTDHLMKLIGIMQNLWNWAKPGVEKFASGIEDALGPVAGVINDIKTAINDVMSALGSINLDPVAMGAQLNTNIAKAVQGDAYTVSTQSGVITGSSGLTDDVYANLANPEGHAGGGDVYGGVPIVVGEQGREVWVPPANGTIIPNPQTEAMMGGGDTYHVNVYADSAEGGASAANAFVRGIREQRAARGVR